MLPLIFYELIIFLNIAFIHVSFFPVNKGESQNLTLLRGKLWMILLDRLFIVPWLPPSYWRETLLKTLEKEFLIHGMYLHQKYSCYFIPLSKYL